MKVLMMIRPDAWKAPAGDTIQLLKLYAKLQQRGLDVQRADSEHVDMRSYDLIHIFSINRAADSYRYYKKAAALGKKVLVTPNFVDMGRVPEIGPASLGAWRAANLMRREVLAGACLILPNSNMEGAWIREALFIDTPMLVVYNGVDPEMAKGDGERFRQEYRLQDFILCVGRIAPLKNQLGLLRGAEGLPMPVVLIGPVGSLTYAQRCTEAGAGRVRILKPMSPLQLRDAYQAAAVHIQPSFFETAGLATLEAAAAGTRVVSTARGAAQEYFGSEIPYVDPANTASIKNGLLQALDAPKGDTVKHLVLSRYTWDAAAECVLSAYRQVLEAPTEQCAYSGPMMSRAYKLPDQAKTAEDTSDADRKL